MDEFISQYPVILSQELSWGDMDAFLHVNNKVYFRFFEDARIAFFDRTGVTELMDRERIGPILARTSCDFLLPLDYPDRIHIGTRVSTLKPKTLLMEYAVFSVALQKVAAEGESLVVYYDYNRGATCRIPETIVGNIRRLGNG